MSTKGVGRPGWITRFGAKRVEINQREGLEGPAPQVLDPRKVDRLQGAGFSKKLVDAHGVSLAGATKDAAAVTAFVEGLGWRGRSVGRLVDQLYKSLSLALDQVPEERRSELAERSLAAVRKIIERAGDGDRLIPTLGAVVSLFDFSVRQVEQGHVHPQPDAQVSQVESAAEDVAALEAALGARIGAGRSLTLYPALVERIERKLGPMTPAKRQDLRQRVAKFLVETGPLTGFRPETSGQLAMLLNQALEEAKTPAAALFETAAAYRATNQEQLEEARRQLAAADPYAAQDPAKKALFERMNVVLGEVLDAHPNAPPAFYQQVTQARASLVQQLRYGRGEDPKHYEPLIDLIGRFGKTEAAQPFLTWVANITYQYQRQPDAAEMIRNAVKEKDGAKAARLLAEASLLLSGNRVDPKAPVAKALAEIETLPPAGALAAQLALHQILQYPNDHAPAVVRAVVGEASLQSRDDPFKHLEQVASLAGPVQQALARHAIHEQTPKQREALAAELTRVISRASYAGNAPAQAAMMIQSVQQSLPKADATSLVDASEDRPGIWNLVNPALQWRVPPQDLLPQILAAMTRAKIDKKDQAVQTRAARVAIELAAVVGNLDGDHQIPFEQILTDLERGLAAPSKLTFAVREEGAVGVRAQKKPDAFAFLKAHDALPMELRMSAGRHLDPEQIGWLIERCETSTGRDTRRALRDFTLGCIKAKKLAFFDAIRTSDAPAKSVSRVIHFVARAYREDKLADLPFAQIDKELAKGADPIVELEEKAAREALKDLNLAEVVAGKVDPAGLAELSRCAEAIRYIMEHLEPGHREDGIDCHERLHGVFLDVLKATAEGRWPEPKYESEWGKKNLACLDPRQKALWRTESVTAAGASPGAMRALGEAVHLLRGLDAALRDHEDLLATPGMNRLGFTAKSLERLEKEHGDVLAQLRRCKKGSARHRELSNRMSELGAPLAILRFSLALQAQKGDAESLLLELRPLLVDLKAALSRRNLPNLARIVDRVEHTAGQIRTSPKEGAYAADEDNLFALLTSTNTGGCVSYTGFRRYANVGFAANAGDKLIRAYADGKFMGRSVLKLFEAKIDGYDGPVLWLNNIALTNGGGQEQTDLITRHAINKARAMGIPLCTSQVDPSAQAERMGLACEQKDVAGRIPDNATGTSFANYTIVPSTDHDIRTKMAGKAYFEHTQRNCWVVKP